ncbi:proton channel OTOP2-like [Sphaeramia orbicularis]|uniref:proton channel OTOP2-like n=1 Tax=Sphaeramia orbicularis TaxID=375764 RepID=UPI00117D0A72|nr:proton channel OTOP2-like [Sphaeramia orbicularis]
MDNMQSSLSPTTNVENTGDDCVRLKEVVRERAQRGTGQLLSGIICINILFLGCAIVSGSAFKSVTITAVQRQIFLIILLLLTMLWMLFYIVCTYRTDQSPQSKDSHAAPVWLRAGLVLFGLLSLLMDVFKICTSVGYLHCDSAVKVAFPVVQAVFLFVQTYFFIGHAKDCVQLQTTISRCGLAVTLSTNLMVWIAAVTEESIHHTEVPEINISVSYRKYIASQSSHKECKCNLSACETFKEAYCFLYPFNIEYSLFASAMAYVMWKNVGRRAKTHSHHSAKFHVKDVCLGPLMGTGLVLAGLVTFILYEVDIEKDIKRRNTALFVHFVMNIVIVSLMSAFSVVGCVIYRLDRKKAVSENNPSKRLDVGLLLGSSLGQFFISYFTIVAVVATGARGVLNGLNLAWGVLMVLQISLQNYFIIQGLDQEQHEAMPLTNADTPQEHAEINVVEVGSCTNYSPKSNLHKHWKRRVLKEICAFLLLANIILWIMPAFGARPQFEQNTEIKFYKFTMWASIVNIGLPFAIFYRMHAVVSLFEVYLIS